MPIKFNKSQLMNVVGFVSIRFVLIISETVALFLNFKFKVRISFVSEQLNERSFCHFSNNDDNYAVRCR